MRVTFPEFEFVLPEFSARPDVVSGKFREIWPKFSPTRGNTLENPGNTHVIIDGTNSSHVMYLRDAPKTFGRGSDFLGSAGSNSKI